MELLPLLNHDRLEVYAVLLFIVMVMAIYLVYCIGSQQKP